MGTATLRHEFLALYSRGFPMGQWWQFNFLVTGDVTPGVNAGAWGNLWSAHFVPYIATLYPNDVIHPHFQWNMTTPAFTYFMEWNLTITPSAAPVVQVQQNGAAIILHTDNHGPGGTGRFHFPWLQPSDTSISKILPSFYTRCSAFLSFFTTTHTVGGFTFTPCVWSRKYGTFSPITRISVARNVMYLRKRRPLWSKSRVPIAWPIAWPP